MPKANDNKGFTLLEALFAIILVGLAVASLMVANSSLTQANAFGLELSTAEFMIEQVRELTDLLLVVDPCETEVFGPEEADLAYYDDVYDFDDATFSPPISSARETLSEFAAYTQQVTVQKVSETDLQEVVEDYSESNFVRVTAKVLLNNNEISSSCWIRADTENLD